MKKTKAKDSNEQEVLKSQLARALADYDNLRKRVEAEKDLWIDLATERLATKLLPVIDMFESGQEQIKDSGLAIAIGEFKKVIIEEGISEIKPEKGEVFDPGIHEAVESVEGGEKGKVADLVLPGWRYNDGKVLRAAKVKVYGKKEEDKVGLEKN